MADTASDDNVPKYEIPLKPLEQIIQGYPLLRMPFLEPDFNERVLNCPKKAGTLMWQLNHYFQHLYFVYDNAAAGLFRSNFYFQHRDICQVISAEPTIEKRYALTRLLKMLSFGKKDQPLPETTALMTTQTEIAKSENGWIILGMLGTIEYLMPRVLAPIRTSLSHLGLNKLDFFELYQLEGSELILQNLQPHFLKHEKDIISGVGKTMNSFYNLFAALAAQASDIQIPQ